MLNRVFVRRVQAEADVVSQSGQLGERGLELAEAMKELGTLYEKIETYTTDMVRLNPYPITVFPRNPVRTRISIMCGRAHFPRLISEPQHKMTSF